MRFAEILLLLQIVVVVLVASSGKLRIPYPILLVLGGLLLSFVPGLPRLQLNPDVVFLLFLPPILHYSAMATEWREFRRYFSAIAVLAVVLVVFTSGVVAVVAYYWLGLPWEIGLILGAIVSPPDAIAATAVMRTMRVPRALSTIVEGESLINDAAALVLYQFAITGLLKDSFTLAGSGVAFFLVGGGGLLLGLALGWISTQARRLLSGSPAALMVVIMTPFFVYTTADVLGVSGVLATVASGLYIAQAGIAYIAPALRMQARAIWEAVVFLINGLAFILIGLQLPHVSEGLTVTVGEGHLALQAGVICLAVMAARFLFILPGYGLLRLWSHRHPLAHPRTVGWRGSVFVSWTGMRGIVSLAAALAVPLTLNSGKPFPYRQEILFVSFSVVVVTLVVQGLTLPGLIRLLKLKATDDDSHEETQALLAMTDTALKELELVRQVETIPPHFETFLRQRYLELQESARRDAGEGATEMMAYADRVRILRRLLAAERRQLMHLRQTGEIGDELFMRLLSRLDHRELIL